MGDVSKEELEKQVKAITAKFEDISANTGVSTYMVHMIWSTTKAGIEVQSSLRGADVVRLLITELHLKRKGYVDDILRKNGIRISADIGKVVFGLTDAGLLKKEETDCQEDFDGLFETDRIWDYIKREKIKKKSNRVYELSLVIFVAAVIIFIVDRERRLSDIWWMIAWVLFAVSALLYFFRERIQKMMDKEN